MSKIWTINVQVNTLYFKQQTAVGTWEQPVGGNMYWRNNVRMAAVSDNPADAISIGDGDSFSLQVGKDDTIKWIVSEVNPIYTNYRSMSMYGFDTGSNWNDNLTPPNTIITELEVAAVKTGFNAAKQPAERWIDASTIDISIPQTTVRAKAKNASISYLMKLVLIDVSDINNPRPINFFRIDPTIVIKLT
ncbi:hypothetical protein F6R98_14445 [Candidatus Methylospira mobilis]|uniref:Inclusion body protein n=1 Tax=Candidatus Methylospira mobilis TaxID=1808979 RepID=A0A5Q0BPM2_9GAMM|nr:hypothetical protein [Candidatus Methylospira mobilis]QFY43676.1 hypothetical protein F6R98_14445 [Candidatus Methylospira mobilis]WNV04663.1 hypothetical protein RP726_20080 [Candidatus Methylospira mobilis]